MKLRHIIKPREFTPALFWSFEDITARYSVNAGSKLLIISLTLPPIMWFNYKTEIVLSAVLKSEFTVTRVTERK